MTQRQLFSICSRARTREEIRAAWDARAAYLREHPDDDEAIQIGASLSRYEEMLDLLGRDHESATEAVGTAAGKAGTRGATTVSK